MQSPTRWLEVQQIIQLKDIIIVTHTIINLLSSITVPAESTDNHATTSHIVVHIPIEVIHWPSEVTVSCALIAISATSVIKFSVLSPIIVIAPNSSDEIIISAQSCHWSVPIIDVTSLVALKWSSCVTAAIAVFPVFCSIVMISVHAIYGLSSRAYKIMVGIIRIAGRICLRNQCRC